MIARIAGGHRNDPRDTTAPRRSMAGAKRIGASWFGVFLAIGLVFSCTPGFAAEARVLFLRGWFGVFSTGLDTLAEELKAKGIKAEVAGHLHWDAAVTDIVRARAAGETGPLVLVGHSAGANNVIDMARALEKHKITVDLLITLAPLLQNPVPANVLRAVNYYQSPGWGAPLAGDRGFHGKLSNVNLIDDPTILHVSIDKSTRVQADIRREIEAVARGK
jgi:hypothetical protein